MTPNDTNADEHCVNRAAGSLYVTPDGRMVSYCSSKITNDSGQLKFEEHVLSP